MCPLGSVPPPPPNLSELEAARKLRPGGSTARPGKVPAASRPCSRSAWPSHASCRKKHMPCLTPGRSRPPSYPSAQCHMLWAAQSGARPPLCSQAVLSLAHTVESGECRSRKGEKERTRSAGKRMESSVEEMTLRKCLKE